MYKGERLNGISHLIGAVLALAGGVVLVTFAAMDGDVRKIISFSVYGFTLFLLYLISALYHSLRGPAKPIFQILDHQAIYLLIAGTYTPFTLVYLRGHWGWTLFGRVWSIAIAGMIMELIVKQRYKRISIGLHLGLGWLIMIAIKPMLANVAPGGMVLLPITDTMLMNTCELA